MSILDKLKKKGSVKTATSVKEVPQIDRRTRFERRSEVAFLRRKPEADRLNRLGEIDKEAKKQKQKELEKKAEANRQRRIKRDDIRKAIAARHKVNWKRVILMSKKGEKYVIKSKVGKNLVVNK